MDEDILAFFEYLFDSSTEDEYYEVRLLLIDDKQIYKLLKIYCEKNDLILKNGISIFVNKTNYHKLLALLSHEKLKFCKPCYSVNPRVMVKNNIGGSYEFMKSVRRVYFDIEYAGDIQMPEHLNNRVEIIIEYLKKYKLIHYTLIDSGVGRHLIYNIFPQNITDARKLYYKKFVEFITDTFNNEFIKIDIPKDFTRVLGFPGTFNKKRNKYVKILKLEKQVNEFKLYSARVARSAKGKSMDINFSVNEKSDLKKIMLMLKQSFPDDAPVNNILFFNFKLLLSKYCDNKKVEWDAIVERFKSFVSEVERIQKYKFPMNRPKPDLYYSRKKLNDFCQEWCKKVTF